MVHKPERVAVQNNDLAGRLATVAPRQMEVARLMALDLDNAQIAYALGITEATVKAHDSALLARLNVRSRVGVVLALHGVDVSRPVARAKLAEWHKAKTGRASEGL